MISCIISWVHAVSESLIVECDMLIRLDSDTFIANAVICLEIADLSRDKLLLILPNSRKIYQRE